MAKAKASNDEAPHEFEIGKAFLVHTHLGIWLGRVRGLSLDEVTLDACSWVADQGRMGGCVRDGSITESEFVGDSVVVPRNSIKVPWRHELPTKDIESR
ncbi:MAG TPA: hypothetical protein VGG74_11860 [Kofleriaceae bacterium]|jgi:hypothetical protein